MSPSMLRSFAGRLALAASLALFATAVAAQAPGGMPGGGGRGPGGMAGSRAAGEAPAILPPMGIAELVRLQLGELEEDLKLLPAQRAVWSTYADRMAKLADDVARTRAMTRTPEGSAVAQLDRLGDVARDRLTAVEDIVDAGKALYSTLAPPQREIADRRLARIGLPLLNATEAATPARRDVGDGPGSAGSRTERGRGR